MNDLDKLVTLIKPLLTTHQDTIMAIIDKYGDEAYSVILRMLTSKKVAQREFSELIKNADPNTLLDIAISEFELANESKKRAEAFLSDIGQGLGILLKMAIKSALPIP